MKFRTPFTVSPDRGEINSGEIIVQPGQSFTTREIYERFITTGRVLGASRPVEYDTDKGEVDFDDYIDRPIDLTDIGDQLEKLNVMFQQRKQAVEKELERKSETSSRETSVAE